MGYIGMCRCEGYGFQAFYSRIGYINQSVWVQNRVSFFRKLISWLKILSRLGKQLLQDRGIWGVYSSIGWQNSADLQAVCVTRFDQSECVICRVIFALGKTVFRGICGEIFALFQACVGNFDTIPPWKVVGTLYLDSSCVTF